MKIDISSFRSIRVLVVGDLMLDRYWSGPTSRISPEAPVPVVQVTKVDERPGGAGNVALNLAALGAQVDLLSYCGQDETGDRLINMLSDAGIACHVHRLESIRTTLKLRVLSVHQQLLRLDFEEVMPQLTLEQLKLDFERRAQSADIIIFSDYGKGCLQNMAMWIDLARQANKPIFVDPKRSDVNVYQGATVLTPNRREFEEMVGLCADEPTLVKKARVVLEQYAIEALLITRGEQGMTLVQRDQPEVHLPALAQQVYDVTGAGDTVVACLALAYHAMQKEWVSAATLANIAAGLVVGKLGAATIDPAELILAASTQSTLLQTGRLSEAALQTVVKAVKAQGKKIVMTSGCFDILHAGHVSYLTAAKALGDYLIVAVNEDVSIKRLKGEKRPIHTLDQRIKVLAGLSAVDWLVSFNDVTPERLIEWIQPDVWVKGSDYQLSELPEAKVVQRYGGEVKLLDLVQGCSTTAILAALKNE
jgi:D-beta-D-heptose 7-phosphate kinase / D-beta-D-heptose 1-phosphate adenosyltransferase